MSGRSLTYEIALGRSAALGGFALEGSPAPGGNIDMLGTNASNIEHSRRLRGTGLRPEDSPGGHFVSYVLGTVRRKLSASVPNVVWMSGRVERESVRTAYPSSDLGLSSHESDGGPDKSYRAGPSLLNHADPPKHIRTTVPTT